MKEELNWQLKRLTFIEELKFIKEIELKKELKWQLKKLKFMKEMK